MGNADLRDLAAIETVPVETIAGETIAIDAHNWLYRYLTIVVRFTGSDTYTTAEGTEVANLIGIIQGLPRLLEADATPVFVFDGEPSELKAEEIAARRASRDKREQKLADARAEGDDVEIARLESQTQRLTETIKTTSRELLEILDIPVVKAPAEGEAQAARMATTEAVDSVGSEDYDTLLFGAPVTYRQLTSSGDIERMDLEATLATHGISREQLIDVGLLCGTDFNDGVRGFGPKTALKAIKDHGTLDAVLAANDAEIPLADRIRSLFVDPPATDDYTIDKTIHPDLDRAREYVCEQWEVAETEVERGFERIEAASTQTGLDRWTDS